MAPSWSPIPAKHVIDADRGVVRESPNTTSSPGFSESHLSLDEISESHTSISPSSQADASYEPRHIQPPDQTYPLIPPHPIPPMGINDTVAVPIPIPDGQFSCPQCSRKFSSVGKASYHVQNYRHIHRCPIAGCRLSFALLKDQLRHSDTHNTPKRRTRYRCDFPECSETASRRDGLKRHKERFHSELSET
ncbi:hypothetical protein N431DRAFT_476621 [Stipitochalara longipes BDJ]|nr:hypothetical protein N431DRAFT_476621 [Stipitochalara longipes BDJ]